MILQNLKLRRLKVGEKLQRGDWVDTIHSYTFMDSISRLNDSLAGSTIRPDSYFYYRIEYPRKKLRRKQKRFIKPKDRTLHPRNIDLHL